MKKYIILMFSLLTLIGCEEITNTAEKSAITYLPVITIGAEEDVFLACDDTEGFTDLGAEANEGGSPIEVETVVTGQYFGGSIVDVPGGVWEYENKAAVDTEDFYTIAYSAVNKDGIPAAAFQHVEWPVCNESLTVGFAGTYSSTIIRTRPDGSAAGSYTDLEAVLIKKIGANQYQLSDALGGWYDLGRRFGYTGSAPGMTVTVNNFATNSFSYGAPVLDQTFGDLVAVSDLKVDAVAGTVTWTATWDAGFNFKVTLKQIN